MQLAVLAEQAAQPRGVGISDAHGGRECGAGGFGRGYRAGGSSTRLMTWIVPFAAATSRCTTFVRALFRYTVPLRMRMRMLRPASVRARRDRLRIEYLAVAAESRRQGVGARLVEAAEAWDQPLARRSPKQRPTTEARSRFRSEGNT